MGKYSSLKGTLEAAPQEPSWQAKINVKKREFASLSPEDLGKKTKEVKLRKEKLNEDLKQVNVEEEALQQMMLEFFEQNGVTSMKLAIGGTLSIRDSVYCQVKDQPTFLKWIRETGQEDYLTVNHQTMNSMVTERLLAGEDAPPGVKPYYKQKVQLYSR